MANGMAGIFDFEQVRHVSFVVAITKQLDA